MADWIELFEEQYLSVDKMNAIYNDFHYLNEQLAKKGYAVYEISDNSVTYSIHPSLILDKMNTVERNIQKLEQAADWLNPYYSVFEWAHSTVNKKAEVDRWIKYLNFTYAVLNGDLRPSQYLIDKHGYYITDIYGNYILIYREAENE